MARGDSLFRQWELIKALQAHRFGISTEDLAARLECNKRTVQRDINVLQDIFPISREERDHGKRYWKLAHNTVESEQLQLTMTEMISLFLSQQLLLPLAGTQFGDGLQTAIQKIRALLPARALTYFEGKSWETNIPFDLAVDIVPELLHDADSLFHQLASKSPQDVEGFERIVGNSSVIIVDRFSYRRMMISNRTSPPERGNCFMPMSSMINRSRAHAEARNEAAVG